MILFQSLVVYYYKGSFLILEMAARTGLTVLLIADIADEIFLLL